MRRRGNTGRSVLIVITALILMMVVAHYCSNLLKAKIVENSYNVMTEACTQTMDKLCSLIEERFRVLQSIADDKALDNENPEELFKHTKALLDEYGFARIGICFKDGKIFSSDNSVPDVSFDRFYGDNVVKINDYGYVLKCEESANIWHFGCEVEDKNKEVIAFLFADMDDGWIADAITYNLYNDRSFTYLFDSEGWILVHSVDEQIPEYENMSEFFDTYFEEGDEAVEKIKTAIEEDAILTGSVKLFMDCEFCVMPVTRQEINGLDENWEGTYMFTLLPADMVSASINELFASVSFMFVITIVISFITIMAYISSYRGQRRELYYLAYSDELTSGDNLASFREKIKKIKPEHGYIVAMDMVDFKVINNSCGAEVGDMTLISVWSVLDELLTEGELLARVYADRFIMYIHAQNDEEAARRIDTAVNRITEIADELTVPRLFPVFGVYLYDFYDDLDTNYGKAIQAKNKIKNRRDIHYAFYEAEDAMSLLQDKIIEDEFDNAIKNGRYEVWYQPKYDTCIEKIVGAEALVRLRAEDGRVLPPAKFIPLFEKNGMIPQLDEYVFKTVCNQQKKWLSEGKRVLPVSVNISRISLYYGDVADRYSAIPKAISLKPEYLQLEITESATINNPDLENLIEKFHAAGFRMLLDDFGSGFSSLSALNKLSFDVMKIDKSLIDYIGDEKGEELLNYITRLGQNLGLHITAEGVETKEQLEFLKELRCDDIQGYYFSKPLPVAEYEKLLEQMQE